MRRFWVALWNTYYGPRTIVFNTQEATKKLDAEEIIPVVECPKGHVVVKFDELRKMFQDIHEGFLSVSDAIKTLEPETLTE